MQSIHLLQRIRLLILGLILGLALPARAACNLDIAFSPPFPTTINGTQTVGAVIYDGSITYTTTGCFLAYTSNTVSFNFGWPYVGGTGNPISGTTGLNAVATSVAVLSNSTGYSMYTSQFSPQLTQMWTNFFQTAGHNENFKIQVGLKIVATQTAVSGTIPSALTTGTVLTTGAGSGPSSCSGAWAAMSTTAMQCNSVTISGYSGTTITSNACTVSTPSVTVLLPTVAKTSLATAGATAGMTPFTLNFTGCNGSTSGFAATQTWSFTPGPASNVMANTGTASSVYAQILDSTMTPIANGGTTTFTVPAAGGSQSRQFYARYYSAGGANAGSLLSTATFTMSYL